MNAPVNTVLFQPMFMVPNPFYAKHGLSNNGSRSIAFRFSTFYPDFVSIEDDGAGGRVARAHVRVREA